MTPAFNINSFLNQKETVIVPRISTTSLFVAKLREKESLVKFFALTNALSAEKLTSTIEDND